MADVFLSYQRDDRGRAKEVAEAIERHGFSVFFDVEIDVGDSWDARIERELGAARCVIVLWSGRSRDSRWVRNEARDGLGRGILAPVLVGDCRIPTEFTDVQTVDLQAWRGDPAAPEWRRLIERITECVQKPAKPLAARPWRRRWVRVAAVVAVVGVLVVAGFVYAPQLLPREGEAGKAPAQAPGLPDAATEAELRAEASTYVTSRSCPQLASWVRDMRPAYPDWSHVELVAGQYSRACGGTVEAAPALGVAQTPALGAQQVESFLASLRPRDPAPLSDAQVGQSAVRLGVEPAAVRAIMEFENGRETGFAADGRPSIQYEPHVFSRMTGHRFDASHPEISSRALNRRLYHRTQEERWRQFEAAYALDANAAMDATGWGRFRIMGLNHRECGFNTVEDFVRAQAESEEGQLRSFEAFLTSQNLVRFLRPPPDWAGFARGYFGAPNFTQSLSAAYQRASAP